MEVLAVLVLLGVEALQQCLAVKPEIEQTGQTLKTFSPKLRRYRRDTTIGNGVMTTSKMVHIKRDKIFYFV